MFPPIKSAYYFILTLPITSAAVMGEICFANYTATLRFVHRSRPSLGTSPIF
jgi:hypothetical protein